MTSCDDRIEQLVDAAEGEASAEFAGHLAGCAGCRAELDAFRATSLLLERTREEPADLSIAGFAHRVTDAAELRRDGTLRGLWRRLGWKQRLSVGLGASTCAAMGAAVVLAIGVAPGIGTTNAPTDPTTTLASLERSAGANDGVGSDADDASAGDVEALLLAWDGSPLPTLDDGFGDLAEDELVALTSLLDTGSRFAEETL